jgi:hypothetical protein
MSNEIEPVEMIPAAATVVDSPSFIIEPLPNLFSIWLMASSSALVLSPVVIFVLHNDNMNNH